MRLLATKFWRAIDTDLALRFLAEAGTRGIAFAIIPLLSWSIGAEAFGRYNQLSSFSLALVPLVSAGLGFTVIRQLAGRALDRHSLGRFLQAAAVLSLLVFGAAAILLWQAEPLMTWLGIDGLRIYPAMLLVVLLSWTAALDALFMEFCRALGLVRRSVLIQIATSFLFLLILLVLLLSDALTVLHALSAMVAARVMIFVPSLAITIRQARASKFCPDEKLGPLPLLTGLPFMITGFAEWGGNLADRLVVGKYLGPEILAIWAAAIMLLSLLSALGAPIWWLLFPGVARAVNQGLPVDKVAGKYLAIYAWLAFPLAGLLIVLADPLLSVLLNKPVEGMSVILALMAISVLFTDLVSAHEYYLMTISGGKRLMVISACCLLGGVGAAIVFVPQFGLMGAAAAILGGRLCRSIVIRLMARRANFPHRSGARSAVIQAGIVAITGMGITSGLLFWVPLEAPFPLLMAGGIAYVMVIAIAYTAMWRQGRFRLLTGDQGPETRL